jgi:hypothetical protein
MQWRPWRQIRGLRLHFHRLHASICIKLALGCLLGHSVRSHQANCDHLPNVHGSASKLHCTFAAKQRTFGEIPSMSQTFSPSKLLESLHSLPRFGYGNQIINKDAPLSDWRYYLRGIGINSGIYAVVGTVAFIAVILTYSAACCCRPMACCNRLYAFKGILV